MLAPDLYDVSSCFCNGLAKDAFTQAWFRSLFLMKVPGAATVVVLTLAPWAL